ncbi:MAG: lamin tail domain-containing protein [Candidatus Bipolaricaulota bacterium]|nr:MAG: lamin tail domain-containing protein [Candidatus Bipolaricaulota bacterium]
MGRKRRAFAHGDRFRGRHRAARWLCVALPLVLASCTIGGQPPVAAFVASVDGESAPLTVHFDGSGSYGRTNVIVGFVWAFGDGHSASGRQVTHTYAEPGRYTVELTVTDRRGRSARVSSGMDVRVRQLPTVGCLCFAEPFHANAVGNDNANLNDEYVTVHNEGPWDVDLTAWTLGDEGGHVYRFPAGFVLRAEAYVSIHTGTGTDTAHVLYWGWHEEIWNNESDIAILWDASGRIVSLYAYMDAQE